MPRLTTFRTIGTSLVTALAVIAVGAGSSTADDMTGPPEPPANLRATDVQPESITIAWDAVPDATEYRVSVVPLEVGPGSPTPSIELTGLTAQIDNLNWDVPHNIHVRAFVPIFYPNHWSDVASITVTTPLPDDYQPPTPPTDLRIERNAAGEAETIRWDPPRQGAAPFLYWVFLDNPETTGRLVRLSTTSIRVDDTPIAAIFEPGVQSTVRITAWDRIFTESAPTEPLVLTCCPH